WPKPGWCTHHLLLSRSPFAIDCLHLRGIGRACRSPCRRLNCHRGDIRSLRGMAAAGRRPARGPPSAALDRQATDAALALVDKERTGRVSRMLTMAAGRTMDGLTGWKPGEISLRAGQPEEACLEF